MKFDLPPRLTTSEGRPRRVGFELEFGGVGLPESAEIVREIFGGEITVKSAFQIEVKTSLGKFEIEADAIFLKEKRQEKYLAALGFNPDPAQSRFARGIDDAVASLAGTLIPFEVVTPPIEITKLDCVEEIRRRLHARSARGTNANPLLAFGMQFNPEVAAPTVEFILPVLRAFLLTFDWIYEEAQIPLARKLSPYIKDFPPTYVTLILNPQYAPDLETFKTDYLDQNPTRNRPVDLLPLLAFIDREKVFSYPVEADLVKPRPTFHYRLPNSEIDDPTWTIARDWNRWVAVERLAADDLKLRAMCEDWARVHRAELFPRATWVKRIREWLSE